MEKKTSVKKSPAKKVTKEAKVTKTKKVSKEAPVRRKNNIKLIQEGNEYAKPVVSLLIIVVILVIAYLIYGAVTVDKDLKVEYTEDEISFKKEYEDLNETSNVEVTIPSDNNVTYINVDKLLELFENGNGIVLFGNAKEDNSRLVINSVLDALYDNKVYNLYYFDTEGFQDEYTLENNKIKQVSEGGEGYREVLSYLDSYLSDYTLTKDNGKTVKVGEKRLVVPTLVAINDGEIADLVEGTGEKEEYDVLGKEYLK